MSVYMCVLTYRSSQSESSQRVKGAHDRPHSSDPHWDGVVVGILWTSWEPPRLHQQQVFHPAHMHARLLNKCTNTMLHLNYKYTFICS